MEKMEVTGRQEAFYNSIDRKVYLVGKDIVSPTGSASDLLQSVPSVNVDVEGAVSLRGDSGVSILINGKSSAAMDRDPAAALEALPADAIERVEIITNPSAKYKPDGTAGIINLVLKRTQPANHAGTIRSSVGNDSRYNGSVSGNYQPGKVTLHGRVSVRQDSRPRDGVEERTFPDGAGGRVTTIQRTEEQRRPRSVFADAGFEYKLGPNTEAGGVIGFVTRDDTRHSRQTNLA
jgi:outer membrane receptor protein involved in Fe transport